MSGPECFGVVVRSLGLCAGCYGAWMGVGAIDPEPPHQSAEYIVGALPLFVGGLVLFLGADSIVSIAYRNQLETPQDEGPLDDQPDPPISD